MEQATSRSAKKVALRCVDKVLLEQAIEVGESVSLVIDAPCTVDFAHDIDGTLYWDGGSSLAELVARHDVRVLLARDRLLAIAQMVCFGESSLCKPVPEPRHAHLRADTTFPRAAHSKVLKRIEASEFGQKSKAAGILSSTLAHIVLMALSDGLLLSLSSPNRGLGGVRPYNLPNARHVSSRTSPSIAQQYLQRSEDLEEALSRVLDGPIESDASLDLRVGALLNESFSLTTVEVPIKCEGWYVGAARIRTLVPRQLLTEVQLGQIATIVNEQLRGVFLSARMLDC